MLLSEFKGVIVFAAVVRGIVAFSWISLGIGLQKVFLKIVHEDRKSVVKLALMWGVIFIVSNEAKPIEYFHTVAARIITHRYEVSSRQRSMIGRDVKNENYGRINLIEKVRNNNENNITYHGCWYR